MKYNTTTQKDPSKKIISELLKIDKWILKRIYNVKYFDFNNNYDVYKIENGFTINTLEKALNIELDYNYIYFYVFKQWRLYRGVESILYFTDCPIMSLYNNKKEWIRTPDNINNLSNYSTDFESCRKYPIINNNPYMATVTKQESYIIIQKADFSKRSKRANNYKHDLLIDRFRAANKDDINNSTNRYYINISKNNIRFQNNNIDYEERKPSEKAGYYYSIYHYTMPDKSGYFNPNIEKLKKDAKRIKKEKTEAAFKNGKKENYILQLTIDYNNINDFIFKMFAAGAAAKKGENITTITLTIEKLQKIKKDILYYLNKLENDIFSSGYYNNDIIHFENNLIELHNKSNLESIKNKINEYINFSNLYNYTKTFFNSESDFEKWLENLGYKYVCLENCYNAGKHEIKENKMFIGSYNIYIQNYFDFMQV